MQNVDQRTSIKEEMDVIIHLSEEPVVLQKRMAELSGIFFTVEDTKKAEAAVNVQQQQVIQEMNTGNIRYKNIHTYKTVLNAISTTIDSKDKDQLLSIKGVLHIELNVEAKAMGLASAPSDTVMGTEGDPVYSEIKALWNEGLEGQGVKVAVLDSGIDKNHPDLKAAYKGGRNFVDQSDPEKYSCLRADDDPSETSPDERPIQAPEKYPSTGAPFATHHGTHVAGILAGNNRNGVKGVAPKVDLYAYRVLGAYTGGDISTIIKGIEEAVLQKMDIINLSISDDSDLESHALSIAINNAVLAGVVAISTAGNTGSVRGTVRAPGTSRLGISVGNSTLSDEVDSSSSRGPSRPNFDIKPDIVAPGTEILSTMPRYGVEGSLEYEGAYKQETGTSQSAPYIAGVAALIKQAHPKWTPYDIKVALSNTAKVLNTKTYTVFDQGAGRVQPYAAVHPAILAYTTEEVDVNGAGKIVENKKGTVTFGAVPLTENVSITKTIVVKDSKGDGGIYDVQVHTTYPFQGAKVTVDQSSFILDGECLLQVTLTACENEHPKYRDEILGYIHIVKQDQTVEVSLPFAADFSDGATVTPAIEEFSITKKDISFSNVEVEDTVHVTLSITSDLSYPSLEIIDYISKEPIDSLFYDNGMSLGTRKFPVNRNYTSSWTMQDTTLQDGIYSVDFTGAAKSTLLTNSIGPVFIKSMNPIIEGSIDGLHLSGQITDQYIDFNNTLIEHGNGFDLNDKLHAFYSVTIEKKTGRQVPFLLNQDGSYSVKLDSYQAEKNFVTIVITDEAGNTTEKLLS
ncbi:hypothetical protein DVB69_14485 [Sporosarcina sp. BI001-red]|uniref:S8 family peptidase n=1 Tax=Sporosarcina sp. BI001-red TaxID=2282866 RepID=UPI000E275BAC|nr:S8 family serine peptidase [Sporosarcina sp. BI001-red]REB05482.1 hypothetical protein DVB69_14485 [Sporosarcina sp. BI001-red]